MNRILGIDLGTSTSEIAILKDGKPLVLTNHIGEEITPSVVGISEEEEVIVGKSARDQMLLRPEDTVMEVKRLMGLNETVHMGGKEYKPQEISAFILKYLKECAENYLDEKINRAVITVPAYFTNEQRKATVEAGTLAGLKVERIINEPTAAALAYGIEHMEENKHILVYDLGGGTLDVTLLEMFQGVLEVKASSGNNHLGGKDFDERLMESLTDSFYKEHGINLREDIRAMARIKEACEKCKISLSTEESYSIVLPFIAEKDGAPIALEHTFTKDDFESLIMDLVQSTKTPIDVVLKDSGLSKEDIDIVLLVGGSTRIPLVKKFLTDTLNKVPQSFVDPDLAVVMGAAIQGGIINEELSAEEDILITDVCPYTLGIETLRYISGIPVPDMYAVLINRNTTIPTVKEEVFVTAADDQTEVEIKVYQGDYMKASLNNFLGKFMLTGVPEAPAGKEKIKVRFSYDVNGILEVDAVIVSTGKQAGIVIETSVSDMEEEVDITNWREAPKARKYRVTIKKAELLLEDMEESEEKGELDALIKDLKRYLIKDESEELLKDIEEEILELLYTLEDEE